MLPEPSLEWPEYQPLSSWLRIATEGLSDGSKARIHEEIIAHVRDAVNEGMRAGLAEGLAAEQAVAGLGSPRAARRALRHTYLTRYQAERVSDIARPTRRILFFYGFLLLSAALDALRRTPRDGYILAGMVALMAVAAIALGTAAPSLYRRSRRRTAVALGAGAQALMLFLWAFVRVDIVGFDGRWFLVPLLVWIALYYLPLLSKFGRYRAAT